MPLRSLAFNSRQCELDPGLDVLAQVLPDDLIDRIIESVDRFDMDLRFENIHRNQPAILAAPFSLE